MILLRLISWPYLRKHLLRSVLTTAGIALGVALFVGMYTANDSVLIAFTDTVNRIAGKAQLQVAAGEAGFSEDVLERVQSVREVSAAAPVIEAEVETGIKGEGKLLILAVDITGDRSLRDYDLDGGDEDVMDDPLVFIAQPDSLILTRDFRRSQSHPQRQQDHLRHHGRAAGIHGARTAQGRRDGAGVRRQSRDHGHLRRAEGVRARAAIRPHRYRAARRRDGGAGRGRDSEGGRAGAGGGAAFGAHARLPVAAERVHAGAEGVERVRAVHRDVHHL